jgi:patatin-like phospholipase/acyl hydrolase
MSKESGRVVKILSIDGGGIRGLIPALVLLEIEQRLMKAGKARPFASIFDLIAGTSTGALIALGLALPAAMTPGFDGRGGDRAREPALSMNDIVDFYARRGQEIFPPNLGRKLRTTVQAFRHKYDGMGFETVLADTFGDATLKDGLTNLLITSFDSESLEPRCMKNRPDRPEWADDENFYMRDAARASSAAPTFFSPGLISPVPDNGKKYCLIDGSIFATNPALLAYIEATKIFPEAREFMILSLGTGDDPFGFPYEEIAKWGFIEWINPMKRLPLWSMMSAGQIASVNHMLGRIAGVRYFRISGTLECCSAALDDASPATLSQLRGAAEDIIRSHEAHIESLVQLL